MTKKELNISYTEYENAGQMSKEDQELVKEAIGAMKRAYSPYSGFKVGAAVRLSGGEIVSGSNQENAAYPSGLCAERTALFYAGSRYPDSAVTALAVAAGPDGLICEEPATPCGACRQVMAQYQRKGGRPMEVILVGREKLWKFSSVDDILPFIFDSI